MRNHAKVKVLFSAFCFLILIFDSKTAAEAAASGIDLCIRCVIPSIFPLLMLTIYLTGSLSGLSLPILRPFAQFLFLPPGAEGLLFPSFLSGYPAGAHSITAAYHCGFLSRDHAKAMLAYCNNAGPAFIFGFLSSLFPEKKYLWYLWIIQIAGAFMTAQFVASRETAPARCAFPRTSPKDFIQASIVTMAQICCWIILFQIMLRFLFRWFLWILPDTLSIILSGMFELSNGCLRLAGIEDIRLRFLVASGLLSFGGVCVTMQTQSLCGELFGCKYLFVKAVQSLFSLVLAIICLYGNPLLSLMIPFFIFLFRKRNNSSIPDRIAV